MRLSVSKLRQGQGIALLLVVLSVIGLFKVFERPLAATIAGVLFIALSMGLTATEIFGPRKFRSALYWAAEGFLLLFALPIFIGRLLNPGVPLEEVVLLGLLSLADLHRFSNVAYLVMVAGWSVELWRDSHS